MSPEWPSVKISEVCELIIDCVNKTAPVVDGPTPYKMIRTTNVRDGWVDTINVRNVDEETYKKWTRRGEPRNGDVILTREAPLGEVGLLRDARGIFLGQRLVMYRANPAKLDNRFLLYSLLDDDLQGQIKAFGSGSTVEHMRVPDCEKLILQLPPLKTQQKIGSILSAYDDLIENNTRRIKILEEMARMLYREWFVNFRFPGHEQVKMVDSLLGLIPEGWEVKALGDVADIQWGDTSTTKASYVKDGYKAFSASGADGKLDHYDFDRTGIVLSAIGANCGWTWYVSGKWSCIKNTMRFWASGDLSTEYLFFTTLGKDFWPKRGAAQPFISQGDAKAIQIICPSNTAVNRFSEFAKKVLTQIEVLELKNQNLRQTRDLLLPKLISGEVAV